jgi:hypothetical protein
MVQLRSCYFCGTTGELSEYAALPPALRVDEASTPRVVLCNRCHTKLANVLAPLAESLGREGGRAVDDSTSAPSSAVRPGAQPNDDRGDTTTEPASQAGEPPSSQPEVTFSEPADDTAATEPGDDSSTATSAAGEDAEDAEDRSDASEDSTDRAADAHDTDHDDRDPADVDSAVDAADVDRTAADEKDDPTAADAAPPATDLDRVYHKLLRFLRNREFPLPRAEAEAIAQSAYDLTATEASQVIQRTVDRGVLEERDGELHRR